MKTENLAESFQQSGQFKKAYQKFLLVYKTHPRPELCLKLGDVCRQLENFQEAQSWYRKVKHLMDAKCGLAMTYRGLHQYQKAIRLFKKCLSMYTKKNDTEAQAYVHWALGTTYRFIGNFKEAENHLRISLKNYTMLKDKGGKAYAQCGLGGTLRMRGKPKESGSLYKEANKVFLKMGDQFGLAYSYCGQGNALRMQGEYKAGIPFMKRAIKIYRDIGQKGPCGFVLWSLAQSEIKLKRKKFAVEHLKEAEKFFEQVQDTRGLIYTTLGWGEYYRKFEPRWAASYFQKALKMANRAGLLFEATHAQYFIEGEKVCPLYKKFGVIYPRYKSYKSLP